VALIGGLTNLTDTVSKSGIPGLAGIPLLGRLFSQDSVERDRSELMIAIVPPPDPASGVQRRESAHDPGGNAGHHQVELCAPGGARRAGPAGPAAGTVPAAPRPILSRARRRQAEPRRRPPRHPIAGLPAPVSPGPPAGGHGNGAFPARQHGCGGRGGTFTVEMVLDGGTDVASASPVTIGFRSQAAQPLGCHRRQPVLEGWAATNSFEEHHE